MFGLRFPVHNNAETLTRQPRGHHKATVIVSSEYQNLRELANCFYVVSAALERSSYCKIGNKSNGVLSSPLVLAPALKGMMSLFLSFLLVWIILLEEVTAFRRRFGFFSCGLLRK